MSEITTLSLTAALEGLEQGAFSAVELTQAFIDTIEASNEVLNAYVVKTPDQALAMAAQSDQRRKAGEA
ncbi:MAG: Asp-tRNA(Asn)/Glu-tRNA(Gln) amidotransferase subunit GatA, partial [Pseudomonadota bacterium]